MRTVVVSVVVSLTALLVAGCGSLRPDAMTMEENVQRAQADRKKIDQAYVPVSGPLSLSEAIARSLKYNYDGQLAKTEINMQEKQLDLALAQMLPRLAAGAGYDGRTTYNAAQSIDVFTQQQSLTYSYSQQPQFSTADLTLTWNALDLGLSFFQARQQGYRVLIAIERRRKVIDNIVRSTATAYWRAKTASELLPRIDPMLKTARQILEASRAASAQNLQSPLALLDFQQNMVIVLSELERIRNELSAARIELATLINIPSSTNVVFSGGLADNIEPQFGLNNHRLEDIGLTLRPELRIEAYQKKIDQQDIYKEILKMLPGIGMIGGFNFNSNNLLYTNTWGEIGIRATFNLMSMIQGPRAIAVAKQAVDLSEERRIALSVAILSQINLAINEYANSLDTYKTAKDVDRVGVQIGRVADSVSEAGAQSEADRIRRQLTVLTTRIARDRAQVRVLSSLASVYSATGMDLVPAGAELQDLPTLTSQVEQAIIRWQAGQLPELPAAAPAPEPAPSTSEAPVAPVHTAKVD
ncbi:MAG: TolC family protein [Proteobacteria bacterium]|nr:TolC family protein [Pseudomonadota bacterium]